VDHVAKDRFDRQVLASRHKTRVRLMRNHRGVIRAPTVLRATGRADLLLAAAHSASFGRRSL
jgi:hypothetical protein